MLVDARFYDARFPGNRVIFELADGRTIEVPIDWFPALSAASKENRERFEIDETGWFVTWRDLGERVSVDAVLLTRVPPPCSRVM